MGIIPVLLGGGIPVLSPAGRATLKLLSCKAHEKTGTVGFEYEVVRVREAVG